MLLGLPNFKTMGNMRMEVGAVWDGDIDTWQERYEKLVLPQNCLECQYK